MEITTLTKTEYLKLASILEKDPVFFISEIIGLKQITKPDLCYQRGILKKLGLQVYNARHGNITKQRIAIASCHSVGKSFTFAAAALWFYYSIPNSMVLMTAPTYRQVHNILWAELKKLSYQSITPLGDELLENKLKDSLDPKHFILPFASRDELSHIQGFHQENVLVIVDEAPGISQTTFDAIEGFLTSPCSFLILGGNAIYNPNSNFYHAFTKHKELAVQEPTLSTVFQPAEASQK